MLTNTREDYLETVLKLTERAGEVRVTDLALALGCRLPTVTRTVQAMVAGGWLLHESRQGIRLTRQGRHTALELTRRHDLTVRFLIQVLGFAPEAAEAEARRLEHGLSPVACDRLRAWLDHFDRLDPSVRRAALEFPNRDQETAQSASDAFNGSGFGNSP